jgi:LEA14-like dessication related protein
MTLRRMHGLLRSVIAIVVAGLLISGCASLQPRDPLQVTVAGIEPLQGEGLEMRMNVKLRVQNPNDAPVNYKGVAVEMDVQGKTFATGVANSAGTVPGFGETIIAVPVTISAFRVMRQVLGMVSGEKMQKIEYQLKGKLSSGAMSATRFATSGQFDLPHTQVEATD